MRAGLVLTLAGLSACAPSHDQILPLPVPPQAYDGATCRQLSLMRAKAMRTLIFADLAQDKNYEDDRTRTFGIPTPMATIFEPSHVAEVARLKGETAALSQQLQRAGCVAREG
jgi:hypothetical protein